MNKIKNILFPQQGKEKRIVRTYLVILYLGLIGLLIFTFYKSANNLLVQRTLFPNTVQRQLNMSMLDSRVNPETISYFQDSHLFSSERDLSSFDNGYDYRNQLIYTDIPNLALTAKNEKDYQNILVVADILPERIDASMKARSENFGIDFLLWEWFVDIAFMIVPGFFLLRSIGYRILLYVLFGKK